MDGALPPCLTASHDLPALVPSPRSLTGWSLTGWGLQKRGQAGMRMGATGMSVPGTSVPEMSVPWMRRMGGWRPWRPGRRAPLPGAVGDRYGFYFDPSRHDFSDQVFPGRSYFVAKFKTPQDYVIFREPIATVLRGHMGFGDAQIERVFPGRPRPSGHAAGLIPV